MIGSVYQLAFLVKDLEVAAEQWRARGAGPFFLLPHFTFLDPLYEGRPSDVDISIALGYSGDLMIELIQSHSREPSPFSGFGATPVAHHVAVLAKDFDSELARAQAAGAPIVFTGAFAPSTRMAYVNTREILGLFTEIIEATPDILGMQSMMRTATSEWDGRELFRSF